MSNNPFSGQVTGALAKRLKYRYLSQHFFQPKGMFQLLGLVACYGIYIAHLQDQAPADGDDQPLTIGNQVIIDQLLSWLRLEGFSPTFLTGLIFMVFAATLMIVTWHGQRQFASKNLLIMLQMSIGLLYNNDLLLLLAAQYPIVTTRKTALLLLGVQTIGMIAVWNIVLAQELGMISSIDLARTGSPGVDASMTDLTTKIWGGLLLFVAWQTFSFGLGYIAMSERSHRERLAASNAELQAIQQLLAESERTAERMRIARELHDGLGHHLTALGLHLELALRQSASAGSTDNFNNTHIESLITAQGIAQELLTEVRRAVSRERSEEPIHLENCLRTLCHGIPSLIIDLKFEKQLAIKSPATAHALFRGVQEALSNVCRHAQASQVWIHVGEADNQVFAKVKDNGIGADRIVAGNGLSGMHERVDILGGIVETKSLAGGGFELCMWLPLRESSL